MSATVNQMVKFSIVSVEGNIVVIDESNEHWLEQTRAASPFRSRNARTRSICSSACLVATAWVRLKIPADIDWLEAAAKAIKITEMTPMAINSSISDVPGFIFIASKDCPCRGKDSPY